MRMKQAAPSLTPEEEADLFDQTEYEGFLNLMCSQSRDRGWRVRQDRLELMVHYFDFRLSQVLIYLDRAQEEGLISRTTRVMNYANGPQETTMVEVLAPLNATD